MASDAATSSLASGGTVTTPRVIEATAAGIQDVGHAVTVLREAFWTRPFLLLAGTVLVCGWTTGAA